MAATAFKYSEARVGEQIGQSRETMREIRGNLVPDVDWKKIRGEVLLTEDAVWMIAKLHLAKMPDLELCLPVEKKTEPAPNGAAEHPLRKKMRVVPPMPINPRVVFAQDEDGARSLVWVGLNGTFCFDDEIEVEAHPEQTGILQCVSEIPRDRRRPR